MGGEIRGSRAREQARRDRMLARQLRGRVYSGPGGLYLVSGEPDFRVLRESLAQAFEASTPQLLGPSELGFVAPNIQLVTSSGLTSRGRALQRWRLSLEALARSKRKDSQERARQRSWRTEILSLEQRLLFLRAAAGGAPRAPGGLLEDSLEQAVQRGETQLLRAGASHVWSPILALLAWLGGEGPLEWMVPALQACEVPPSPLRMANLVALLTTTWDRGSPPQRLLEEEQGDPSAFFLALHGIRHKSFFSRLLLVLGEMRTWPDPPTFSALGRLIESGAEARDLDWLYSRFGSHSIYVLSRKPAASPRPLRRLDERLQGTSGALESERLELLLEDLGVHGRTSALDAFVTWLEALPRQALEGRRAGEVARALCALVLAGSGRSELEAVVSRWSRPRGRLGPVPGEPGLPPEGEDSAARELRRLIRTMGLYQSWIGEEPHVPGSVADLLRRRDRQLQERRFLEERARKGPLESGPRARLEYLREREAASRSDPSRDQDRALVQARRVLPRVALDTLQVRLRQLLDGRWRARFGEAPEGLSWEHRLELMTWMEQQEGKNRRRLDEILQAYRNHRAAYRRHLECNRDWLQRAEDRGINLEAWLWPTPEALELGPEGRKIFLRPARDPFSVLLMGSFFDTCLGLKDGFNRESVLGNASEANKALLLVCGSEGEVLGRKLVAVSREGEMLGYWTYLTWEGAHPLRAEATQAVEAYCLRWAQAAGLTRSNQGEPENLAKAFWYDDGPEDWGSESLPPPGELGQIESSFRSRRPEVLGLLQELMPRCHDPGVLLAETPGLFLELLIELSRRSRDATRLRRLQVLVGDSSARRRILLARLEVEGEELFQSGQLAYLGQGTRLAARLRGGRGFEEVSWWKFFDHEAVDDWIGLLGPEVTTNSALRSELLQALRGRGWCSGDPLRTATLFTFLSQGAAGTVPGAILEWVLENLGHSGQDPELALASCLPPVRGGASGWPRKGLLSLVGRLEEWMHSPVHAEQITAHLALSSPLPVNLRFLRERSSGSPTLLLVRALVEKERKLPGVIRQLEESAGELPAMLGLYHLLGEAEGERRLLGMESGNAERVFSARKLYQAWKSLDLDSHFTTPGAFSLEELRASHPLLNFFLRRSQGLGSRPRPGSRSIPPEWLSLWLPRVASWGRRKLFLDLWALVDEPSWFQLVTLSALHPDHPSPEELLAGKSRLHLGLTEWCRQGQPAIPSICPVVLRDQNGRIPPDAVALRDLLRKLSTEQSGEVAQRILAEEDPSPSPLHRVLLQEFQ